MHRDLAIGAPDTPRTQAVASVLKQYVGQSLTTAQVVERVDPTQFLNPNTSSVVNCLMRLVAMGKADRFVEHKVLRWTHRSDGTLTSSPGNTQ